MDAVLSYMSFITVAFLGIKAMVSFNVPESIIHESSLAAVVTVCCRAVHQLLLTERYKVASFKSMLTLQRTCGTKGPAAATLTLRKTPS